MTSTRREFVAGGLAAGALFAGAPLRAQPADPTELSLAHASRLLRRGALSPVELTEAYLQRIERIDPRINSYITVTAESALARARELQAELARGHWRGPLHGVPIALKDNIDTAGIRTTAAATLFAERVPDEDAEVWRRLRDAGAVLLGKTNLHEFAYGGTSAISHFGAVRNPWNTDHIPGGSSGGSAAAVAAGLCAASLGTDTLASVRLPAAYCGTVGLKATHGLASIRGIVPISETLDCVGPITRTVADSALVLQAIAGLDPLDPVSVAAEPADYAAAAYRPVAPLRIGVPRDPYFGNLHPDIDTAVADALDVIDGLTAGCRDIELPEPPGFFELLAEAWWYHRDHLPVGDNRSTYDEVTVERLLAASEVSMADYYEGRRRVALARRAIDRAFDEVDLLVLPTAPGLPETIAMAENPAQATGAESSTRNVFPFNVFGIPAISVPCGFSDSGLPIGLQICGPRLGEVTVLALAHAFEQATEWHTRRPPL